MESTRNGTGHPDFRQPSLSQPPVQPLPSGFESPPQSITIHLMAVTPASTATNSAPGQISVHAIPLQYPINQRFQAQQTTQDPPLTLNCTIPHLVKPGGMWQQSLSRPVNVNHQELPTFGRNYPYQGPPAENYEAPPMCCCHPIPIPANPNEASGSPATVSSPNPGQTQSVCYQVQYMFCPDDVEPGLGGETEAELCIPGSFNDVRGDEPCTCCRCARHRHQLGAGGKKKPRLSKKGIKEEVERSRVNSSNMETPQTTSTEMEYLKIICESLGRAMAVAATAAVEAASKYAGNSNGTSSGSGNSMSGALFKRLVNLDGPVQHEGQTTPQESQRRSNDNEKYKDDDAKASENFGEALVEAPKTPETNSFDNMQRHHEEDYKVDNEISLSNVQTAFQDLEDNKLDPVDSKA